MNSARAFQRAVASSFWIAEKLLSLCLPSLLKPTLTAYLPLKREKAHTGIQCINS